jgi:DNA-binding transcriptional regulator GbsR (MarR family)
MLEIPQEINKTLREIGLDRTEIQVYFLLLKNISMGIQEITDTIKLPRSSVSLACKNLEKRNVLKTLYSGKRVSFYLEKPSDINNYINFEEDIINSNKLAVKSIISKVNNIYAISQENEPIEVEELQGEEGFIETYYRSLEQSSNNETLRIGGDSKLFIIHKKKLIEYTKKRKKRKIYTKLLLPNYEHSKEEQEEAKFHMREVGILNKDIYDPKIQLSIWQDNTAMTVWDKGLHSIIIKNKAIAETLKQLYLIAWNQSNKG